MTDSVSVQTAELSFDSDAEELFKQLLVTHIEGFEHVEVERKGDMDEYRIINTALQDEEDRGDANGT